MKKIVLSIICCFFLSSCVSFKSKEDSINYTNKTITNSTEDTSVIVTTETNDSNLTTEYNWLCDELYERIDELDMMIEQHYYALPPPGIALATTDINGDNVPEIFIGKFYISSMLSEIEYTMYDNNGNEVLNNTFYENYKSEETISLFDKVKYISKTGEEYCLSMYFGQSGTEEYIRICKIFNENSKWMLEEELYKDNDYDIGKEFINNLSDNIEPITTTISVIKNKDDIIQYIKELSK